MNNDYIVSKILDLLNINKPVIWITTNDEEQAQLQIKRALERYK